MFGVCINTLTKCFMSWKYSSLLYILNLILCVPFSFEWLLFYVVQWNGHVTKKKLNTISFLTFFIHVTLYIYSVDFFFSLNDGLVLICSFTPPILNNTNVASSFFKALISNRKIDRRDSTWFPLSERFLIFF